jgi:protein-tyrosine phosphatase
MEKDNQLISPIQNSYWVFEHTLLAGEHPCAYQPQECYTRLQWLLRYGITSFIDLTEEQDYNKSAYLQNLYAEAKALNMHIEYYHMPIPDMSVPNLSDMHQIIKTIDNLLVQRFPIYIHCLGGLGRTGTVVGCYLVHRGKSGSNALQTINQLRQSLPNRYEPSPETEEQRQFVLSWEQIELNKTGG